MGLPSDWTVADAAVRRLAARDLRARRRPRPVLLAGTTDAPLMCAVLRRQADPQMPWPLTEAAMLAACFRPGRVRLSLLAASHEPPRWGRPVGPARPVGSGCLVVGEAQRVADGLVENGWILSLRSRRGGSRWRKPRPTRAPAVLARVLRAALDDEMLAPRDDGQRRDTMQYLAGVGHEISLAHDVAARYGLRGLLIPPPP